MQGHRRKGTQYVLEGLAKDSAPQHVCKRKMGLGLGYMVHPFELASSLCGPKS